MPKCKFFHTFFAGPCKLNLLLIVSTTAVPAPLDIDAESERVGYNNTTKKKVY
jgi:hypothetical protein